MIEERLFEHIRNRNISYQDYNLATNYLYLYQLYSVIVFGGKNNKMRSCVK